MTAPQHNAKPIADQPEAALEGGSPLEATSLDSQPEGGSTNSGTADSGTVLRTESGESRYSSGSTAKRMQRSWLIALGLLGGSGFVANQMSFALAESDFLIDDYVSLPGDTSLNHAVADTTFTYTEDNFSPSVAPAQVEYVPAPAAVAPPVASTAPVEPDWVATYQTPLAAPSVTKAPAVAESVTAAPVAVKAPVVAPSINIEIEPVAETLAPVANTPEQESQSVAASSNRRQSRITQPTVSEVAPPTFTSVRKPKKVKKASKVARRSSPLMGLVSANAMTVPLSNYVAGSMAIAPSMVQLSAGAQMGEAQVSEAETTMLVALEGGSVEMEITPSGESGAVSDILSAEASAAAEPIQPTELVPAALPEGTNLPDEYNSVFVDPTAYSVGATEAPGGTVSGAPEIVVSEETTGCEFTLEAGQGVPNAACGTAPAAPAPIAGGQAVPAPDAYVAAPEYVEAPVASSPAVNVGPVSFSAEGIRFSGSTTAAGREYLNRTVRPLVNLQANERFIFPLAVPSPITSLFGFRMHPISGDYRFHAGTDLGAPQGTPVLAAQDGKVSAAGYAGGYGLMVVLNHDLSETQLESRYAHLAEILVEPDAVVKKGDVIGLVGSTGNSTGPHLHFEMRQMTADGWVLVNADGLIQQSLANLVKALNSPMQALNFSMADFNLLRTKTAPDGLTGATSAEAKTESGVDALLPGLNGIPFRPAQPNAS